MRKNKADHSISQIVIVQIIIALVLIASASFTILYLTKIANEDAKAVAKKNAEVAMKLEVKRVINRIEEISDEKTNDYRMEIDHMASLINLAGESEAIKVAKTNIETLKAAGNDIIPEVIIADNSGNVLYTNSKIASDDARIEEKNISQVGPYKVMVFTTQDQIDKLVKSIIHDEIHNTQYSKNQYVW